MMTMGNSYYKVTLRSDFELDKELNAIRDSFLEQLKNYRGKYAINSVVGAENGEEANVICLGLYCENVPDLYIPKVECDACPYIIISAPNIENVSPIKNRVCRQLMNNDDYDNDNITVSMVNPYKDGYAFSIGFEVATNIIPKLWLFGSERSDHDE